MTADAGSDLRTRGWARYNRDHLTDREGSDDVDLAFGGALTELQAFYRTLPPDRYEPDSNRYRRHSRAVYLPWSRTFSWLPDLPSPEYGGVIDYDMQGYNAEFGNVRRRFPSIPPGIRHNPLLERVVHFDLAQVMWMDGFPVTPLSVGVGCVMLSVPGRDHEAVSTPNTLHQDGGAVSLTFVHLVVRTNVVGGVNVIAPPRCVGLLPSEVAPALIASEFTLEEPLDAFAVHNSRVSHYVSPVQAGGAPGRSERGVLIVAVSPMVKQL